MQDAQFESCPDWLGFLQGLDSNHLEFPQLSVVAYPLTSPTRQCEQSPQAGVSTQNWRDEKLEMGNDVG